LGCYYLLLTDAGGDVNTYYYLDGPGRRG